MSLLSASALAPSAVAKLQSQYCFAWRSLFFPDGKAKRRMAEQETVARDA